MEAPTFVIIDHYEEYLLGLPYPVTLIDTARAEMRDGKQIGVSVPDSEGLAKAVAVQLCQMPFVLLGVEIRFLRRVLQFSQLDFANATGTPLSVLRLIEDFDRPGGIIDGRTFREKIAHRLGECGLPIAIPETASLRHRVSGDTPTLIASRRDPDELGWIIQAIYRPA
jgi:hypothetical protein